MTKCPFPYKIRDDFIKLGQLLKLAGLVESGVDAKYVNKKSLEGLIKSGAFSNIEKSRKQLFENIEHIIDITSKEARDRAMGQVSLFASLGDDGEDFSGVQYRYGGNHRRCSWCASV